MMPPHLGYSFREPRTPTARTCIRFITSEKNCQIEKGPLVGGAVLFRKEYMNEEARRTPDRVQPARGMIKAGCRSDQQCRKRCTRCAFWRCGP